MINLKSNYFKTKNKLNKIKLVVNYYNLNKEIEINTLKELLKYCEIEEEYEKCIEIKKLIDLRLES